MPLSWLSCFCLTLESCGHLRQSLGCFWNLFLPTAPGPKHPKTTNSWHASGSRCLWNASTLAFSCGFPRFLRHAAFAKQTKQTKQLRGCYTLLMILTHKLGIPLLVWHSVPDLASSKHLTVEFFSILAWWLPPKLPPKLEQLKAWARKWRRWFHWWCSFPAISHGIFEADTQQLDLGTGPGAARGRDETQATRESGTHGWRVSQEMAIEIVSFPMKNGDFP